MSSTTTTISESADVSIIQPGTDQVLDTPNPSGQPPTLQQIDILEPAEHSQDEIRYPSGFKFWSIVISLSLVLILAGLDGNILATAVP